MARVVSTAVVLALAAVGAGGQAIGDRPHFEVASLKLSAGLARSGDVASRTRDPGRISYKGAPLVGLVLQAYGLKPYQVVGPDRWGFESYDLDATMPPGTSNAQMRLMLQVLLEERLKLSLHRETRQLPVYVVTIAPGGLRIRKAESAPDTESTVSPLKPPPNAVRGPRAGSGERGLTGKMPVAFLLNYMSSWLDRPMLDRTGLQGDYEINFVWSVDDTQPDGALGAAGSGDNVLSASTPSGGHGFLFSAMEKQLGLKVQARTEPTEITVIDHVERIPVEN